MLATLRTNLEESATRRFAWLRPLACLSVFLVLTWLRVRGISKTFWLLGDQILYWKIALGPWRELPVGGGPSSVGGTTLGPVFCWTLWGIRHLVGPWCGNLPHAGGIGLSMLQSAADVALFAALWTFTASLPIALAVVLFLGTAPFDMALSATIWNPPLAVAFVKTSLALALLGGRDSSAAYDAAATGAALLAVQAHSSAVFVAAPLIASFVARPLLARRWRDAARRAGLLMGVVLLLEIPFLAGLLIHPGRSTSPAIVVNNVSYTLTHPGSLRPSAAFHALVSASQRILLWSWTIPFAGLLFIVCVALAAVRARKDLTLVAGTIAPPLCAVAGFAFWQLPYDDYWFMTIVPSVVLTVTLALTIRRPRPAVAVILLAIVVIGLPARVADAERLFRLPQYGPLVDGSREIRRRAPAIRDITTAFALPESTDPFFLYRVLGGRVTSDAPFAAAIDADGRVTFSELPIEPSAGHGG